MANTNTKDTGYRIQDAGILVFTDLEAWRTSHKLALNIYQETKNFPKEELYGLTSQIRRCAVSVISNIAECFGRFNTKEKMQFYRISAGSLMELQNQLLIARDIGYITEAIFTNIAEQSISAIRLINGLIKSTEKKLNPESRILNPVVSRNKVNFRGDK